MKNIGYLLLQFREISTSKGEEKLQRLLSLREEIREFEEQLGQNWDISLNKFNNFPKLIADVESAINHMKRGKKKVKSR